MPARGLQGYNLNFLILKHDITYFIYEVAIMPSHSAAKFHCENYVWIEKTDGQSEDFQANDQIMN